MPHPPTKAKPSPSVHTSARRGTGQPARFFECRSCDRVWHWHDLGAMDPSPRGPVCPPPCGRTGQLHPCDGTLAVEVLRRVLNRMQAVEITTVEEGHATAAAIWLVIGTLRDAERRLR